MAIDELDYGFDGNGFSVDTQNSVSRDRDRHFAGRPCLLAGKTVESHADQLQSGSGYAQFDGQYYFHRDEFRRAVHEPDFHAQPGVDGHEAPGDFSESDSGTSAD